MRERERERERDRARERQSERDSGREMKGEREGLIHHKQPFLLVALSFDYIVFRLSLTVLMYVLHSPLTL